jgi:type II secretory pathway component PulC
VLELTLNEEVVAELENNWKDLRNQIQITTEERGYRVNYLSDNSIFLQAGLQSGDLISYQTLNSMRNANPEARQLASRVVRIFEYVR